MMALSQANTAYPDVPNINSFQLLCGILSSYVAHNKHDVTKAFPVDTIDLQTWSQLEKDRMIGFMSMVETHFGVNNSWEFLVYLYWMQVDRGWTTLYPHTPFNLIIEYQVIQQDIYINMIKDQPWPHHIEDSLEISFDQSLGREFLTCQLPLSTISMVIAGSSHKLSIPHQIFTLMKTVVDTATFYSKGIG